MRTSTSIKLVACAAGALALAHCFEGGSNPNEKSAGNGRGGVDVSLGEIAVSPDGSYYVATADDRLVLGALDACDARRLDVVRSPGRLAFAHAERRVFVTSLATEELLAVDPDTGGVLWRRPVPTRGFRLHGATAVRLPDLLPSRDDRRLVLGHEQSVEIVDAATGATLSLRALERPIVDLDLTADGADVAVTLAHVWHDEPRTPRHRVATNEVALPPTAGPATTIVLVPVEGGRSRRIGVPNCSSDLVLAPDGRYAFIAPTRCNKDPVSLIDLTGGRFVKNLPGFGPVSISPDGQTVVAFLDAQNLDEALFPPGSARPTPGARYHLMLIDAATLSWRLVPVGAQLPRYALTPDGRVLLVDRHGATEGLRMVDVATGTLRAVSGPKVALESYVVTRDSRRVYLLDDGLHLLSVPDATVAPVPLSFRPTRINLTPDDRWLLLREGQVVHLVSTGSHTLTCDLDPTRLR